MKPCRLVEIYQLLGELCCLHDQERKITLHYWDVCRETDKQNIRNDKLQDSAGGISHLVLTNSCNYYSSSSSPSPSSSSSSSSAEEGPISDL
jgi:hypothetical protein